MIRAFLIFIGLLFLINLSYAQGNLTGRVLENKTRVPLGGISIQNLKSNVITVSDPNGLFSIKAHVGDLVTFSVFSYQTYTLYVKDLISVEIILDLKGTYLQVVTIHYQQTRLCNLTAPPTLSPFGGQTLVYQTDKDGNTIGGLKMNIFDSHANAKKKRKEIELGQNEDTNREIAKIFSPEGLKDYIPLKDQELTNFIILYKPGIETYTDPAFNLTVYIDSCYKEFLKIPADRRKSKDLTDLNAKPD